MQTEKSTKLKKNEIEAPLAVWLVWFELIKTIVPYSPSFPNVQELKIHISMLAPWDPEKTHEVYAGLRQPDFNAPPQLEGNSMAEVSAWAYLCSWGVDLPRSEFMKRNAIGPWIHINTPSTKSPWVLPSLKWVQMVGVQFDPERSMFLRTLPQHIPHLPRAPLPTCFWFSRGQTRYQIDSRYCLIIYFNDLSHSVFGSCDEHQANMTRTWCQVNLVVFFIVLMVTVATSLGYLLEVGCGGAFSLGWFKGIFGAWEHEKRWESPNAINHPRSW